MVRQAKQTASRWIDENKDQIITLSDKIWEYAELGLLEYRSAKLLASELKKQGFHLE